MIADVFRNKLFFLVLGVGILGASIFGQSSDQTFPTPVRTNEISGTIKARDVGDSRLTTYFYTFEGEQGDLFVNVQTRNFSGDIDVYVASGLRPLTKMVMYPETSETETGRVIYLRKPERLVLRIEGRTPGDDDAFFKIKFAGSFAASKLDDSQAPEMPKVNAESNNGIRVNSVGTIIEVVPKPRPTPKETIAAADEPLKAEKEKPAEDEAKKSADDTVKEETTRKTEDESRAEKRSKPEVIITDPVVVETKKETPKAPPRAGRRTRRTTPPKKDPAKEVTADTEPKPPEVEKVGAKPPARTRRTKAAVEPEPDPMENIRLVIYFKDGSTIERPMTEVFKFSVERATLTVISKDGSIGRYKMVEVTRVSIE
jgi:hypothetical protein